MISAPQFQPSSTHFPTIDVHRFPSGSQLAEHRSGLLILVLLLSAPFKQPQQNPGATCPKEPMSPGSAASSPGPPATATAPKPTPRAWQDHVDALDLSTRLGLPEAIRAEGSDLFLGTRTARFRASKNERPKKQNTIQVLSSVL